MLEAQTELEKLGKIADINSEFHVSEGLTAKWKLIWTTANDVVPLLNTDSIEFKIGENIEIPLPKTGNVYQEFYGDRKGILN